MATKLTKYFQKVFGLTDLGADNVAQFGSYANGSYLAAATPGDVQSTTQFSSGWFEAVLGENYPLMEDQNALDYLYSYQLAYLMQMGLAEWDSTTTYFYGSMVNVSGVPYVCFNDDSGAGISNQNPASTLGYWSAAVPYGNSILNGAFDYFQRGFLTQVSYNATTTLAYVADRWAVINKIGSSAVVTGSQQTPSVNGSGAALQIATTTAPGTSSISGPTVVHILDVIDSLPYYGGAGSFGCFLKAIGNTTQVTLQFLYADVSSSVGPALSPVGSGVVVGINTSTTTLGKIIGQAMGTAQTLSGVVGISIEVSAVSSGHVSDAGNGFQIEQAIMVPSGFLPPFERAHSSQASELMAIKAYFEKSFDYLTVPVNNVAAGAEFWSSVTAGTRLDARFKVEKRVLPTITLFNPNNASPGLSTVHDQTNSQDLDPVLSTGTAVSDSKNRFLLEISLGTYNPGDNLLTQWTADAEIY